MARVVIIDDFDEVDRGLGASVVRTTLDFIRRAKGSMEKAVNEERDKFFTRMIQKGIDVRGAPDLDEYTPYWPAYSPKYAWMKRRKRGAGGYYFLTGKLKKSLSSAAVPRTVLGNPKVMLDETDVMRKINGKRVRTVLYEFTVFAAPRLGGLTDHDLHSRLNSKLRAVRLTHVKGDIRRPLFEPFLNWWLAYVVQPRIAGILKR